MTTLHGFEFVREASIPELNTQARLWRHARTGAELLSLENDDENKVFGIAFRTPPADSTGLPHILEHVVLAGSEKYPLKDPFFEMVKGSLATFINAMTYPDKTVYPAASTNLQDFYNLLDVYADAVFHPLMTPEKLAQEGWHYELDAADGPLTYKGVVFNEMKGAYASPDGLLGRLSRQALFPDTTYGVDSGGDPAVIPDLTYEQFRAFHQTHYHPSNARLFFYGDDDPTERLRRMDAYLAPFDRAEVDSAIAIQPAFDAPRTARFPYGAGAAADGDGAAPRAFVEVNWLLPEYNDTALIMALSILSYALVDTPASPLRKALIDSGLGEDVLGGFSTGTRQTTFSAGLKGVAVADIDRVEPLILDTLADLARDGLDPAMIVAALNTIEFRRRENNTGRAPRGLSLLLRSLNTWLHDRDPLAPLAFEAPLAAFREALAADPTYLSRLIRHHLLDNPHRVTVVLEPDADLARRQSEAEAERLAQARAAMSDEEAAAVIDQAADLKRRQETPDPPEVLALLPSLRRADLEPRHKPIPLAEHELAGARVLSHDLFTNGIVYLDLALDLRPLPAELLPYVPLFGRALTQMGTAAEDFVRLSQRIGQTTGGLYATTLVVPVRGGGAATRLVLRGK
ncbi:MAG: insulinase family protein, partial [Candidatus Promineofilum sp.]|nr:insulinase family protein [Promineifilum sp.]